MAKSSKTSVGAALLLGAVVAAGVLSGCTSSGASGTATASATASASGGASTAAGGGSTSAAATGGQTGASTSASANATSAGNSGTAACTDAHLKVTTASAGVGAGHVGWIVVFTNTGSASCSIEGYPGAGVTDQPGQVVLNAEREQFGYLGGQYPSPAAIVLAPGKAASTLIEWVDAPTNGQAPVGANCPGMDGGKVLITPPNTTQSTAFPAPGNLCALFEVHPLISGSSGRIEHY